MYNTAIFPVNFIRNHYTVQMTSKKTEKAKVTLDFDTLLSPGKQAKRNKIAAISDNDVSDEEASRDDNSEESNSKTPTRAVNRRGRGKAKTQKGRSKEGEQVKESAKLYIFIMTCRKRQLVPLVLVRVPRNTWIMLQIKSSSKV